MLLSETESKRAERVIMASAYPTLRSRRPGARGDVFCTEPGRSHLFPRNVAGVDS